MARTPPLAAQYAQARADLSAAIGFGIGALVVFAAPLAVIGAVELPPLGGLAVVLGGAVGGLVLSLVAQAFATAAAAAESEVLDRSNAALIAEARERLEASPPPPPPPAAPEAAPPRASDLPPANSTAPESIGVPP
ncbi:MAG: hypothetical protein JNJ54_19335 [Myxococcaceae bacterium]|nr:hypothetical protein [Myxococcaceae bacterium]